MRQLLIAYDGSDLAKAAVRSAGELFPGGGALVVTVWEPGLSAIATLDSGFDASGMVRLPPDPALAAEVDKAQERHAATVAGEGARLAGSVGLEAEPHAIPDEAHVADAIVDLAVSRDVAAVVIGSHGISGLRSHLFGSTARRVLERCKCPVVVVRAEDGR